MAEAAFARANRLLWSDGRAKLFDVIEACRGVKADDASAPSLQRLA